MPGRIIKKGQWPHRCDPPSWGVPPGTVWECDCGIVWVAEQQWPTFLQHLDWHRERRRERRKRLAP